MESSDVIHPSFLLFILNTIVITFEQFFGLHSPNSKTLHINGRNERRNPFNMKVAKDKKMSGQRKSPRVEAIAKGIIKKAFLTNNEAAELAQTYNIGLPEEGEEKSINSNSKQVIGKHNNKFYIYQK